MYLGIKHAGARCPGGLAHIRIGRTQDTEPAHADSSARVVAHDRGLRATRASRLPSPVAHGQPDNNRLITADTCRIGMNNDRACSFLCLFQTFQTFMSSVLRACVHVCMYYPRHGTFARWCAAKLTVPT